MPFNRIFYSEIRINENFCLIFGMAVDRRKDDTLQLAAALRLGNETAMVLQKRPFRTAKRVLLHGENGHFARRKRPFGGGERQPLMFSRMPRREGTYADGGNDSNPQNYN